MGKNKDLRKELQELREILHAFVMGWKAKHPEDFELPEDSKLIKSVGGISTLCEPKDCRKIIDNILNNLANNFGWDDETLKLVCNTRDLHLYGYNVSQQNSPMKPEEVAERNITSSLCTASKVPSSSEDTQNQELCRCGHDKEEHHYNTYLSRWECNHKGEETKISENLKGYKICSCRKFEPQSKGCGKMYCLTEGCGKWDLSHSAFCVEHGRSYHGICGEKGLCKSCKNKDKIIFVNECKKQNSLQSQSEPNSQEIDVVGKPMIPSTPNTSGKVTSVTPDTNDLIGKEFNKDYAEVVGDELK